MAVIPVLKQNSSVSYQKQRSTLYGWFLLLLTISLVIFALWLPFGFSLTALIEEWGVLGTYISHGLYFIVDLTSPLAAHSSRPLTVFPHSLAYYLDANSFDYWHVLLILSLLIKGFAFAYLIEKITGSLRWASLAGILLIIYPADTMQIAFRGFHINWALSSVLLGSCFFMMATQTERLIRYLIACFLAAGLMFSAICMYEAAIPLLALPFLILYAKEGFRRSYQCLWNRKILILGWIASLAIYLLYLHYIKSKINTYQSSLIDGRSFWQLITQTPYSKLFSIGALRGLMGGWFDAFSILFKEFSFYGYIYLLLITSCICGLLLLAKPLAQNEQDNQLSVSLLRLGVAGFLLLLLGYSLFLFLPSHMATTQRTFLFASPGSVMVWLVTLMLMAKRARKTAFFLSFMLICAGFAAQLFYFHHYMKISTTQRSLLKEIVENFDGRNEKTLLILDKTSQLNYTWMFLVSDLQFALSYLYNHSFTNPILVCRLPGESWQLPGTRAGSCVEKEDNWVFSYPNDFPNKAQSPDKLISKKDLFVLTIKPDGRVHPDPNLEAHRYDLYHGQSQRALRFRNILTEKTWLSYFNPIWKTPTSDRFQWNFGDWWGLEDTISGNGWGEAQWLINIFHHKAIAWKIAKDANLQFKLRPTSDFYQLKIRLANMVNENVRNSLKIRINEHEVSFRWLDFESNPFVPNSMVLVATIPSKDLRFGVNSIVFNSEVVKEYYGLSFQLASIDLFPINSLNKNNINTDIKDKA
ncbi:hypothetical protein [Legionella drozanskii]|uniref:Glycosyltransferase RgtA/B/C/D-like domain-containing protein n=1 Tax=Legionella drozanskii LLAP-1 TaxID=1212489 RepID=A0A0W0SQ30_9GAMM|nr:hypothetical protein [Legionella drozanskii]KTC85480.1 hypothetical protein Ldro_2652 [Legionella drozanskii LLAP-1]